MSNTNFDKLLFRPSQLGDIYSGVAKGWSVDKSLTCKRALIKIYRELKYNRYYTFTNKYTEKGLAQEESGIDLLSVFHKRLYRKNEERLTNDYFTGEPDIIVPKLETIDIKCVWDLSTLPHPLTDKLEIENKLQGVGYMDLTGAKKHTVAKCLVNATSRLVVKAKEDLWYRMQCPSDGDKLFPKYHAAIIDIEKNMIFDKKLFLKDNKGYDFDCKEWVYDIPVEDRVVEFTFDADPELLQVVKDRINECREWLNRNFGKEVSNLKAA